MNVTYISALYNIYSGKKDAETIVSNRLLRDVGILLVQPIKLIIYVDQFYWDVLSELPKSDTVTIIHLPIEELHIYNMIVKNAEHIKLPGSRNLEKDTHEYIALMNTKVEFMYRASLLNTSEYLAWIDAGCSKMFKEPTESISRLVQCELKDISKILIPGCYMRYCNFNELQNNVWWIFLGTFFICNKNFILEFYNLSLQALVRFLIKNIMVWEVNVWIDIMNTHSSTFEWYYSNHDDGFTKFPAQFLI